MGIPGKERRFRNFEQNAENAAVTMTRDRGFKWIERIGRQFKVAMGTKSQRMIAKSGRQLERILEHQQWLVDRFESGRKPKTFTLEPFKGLVTKTRLDGGKYPPKVGIQQYYDKPTIYNLMAYLELKEKGTTEFRTSKNEYLLAKKFMRRKAHRGITFDQLAKVTNELARISWKDPALSSYIPPWASNTIIQGVNKDGTLRITLIDI
jgi:hypothetical protein